MALKNLLKKNKSSAVYLLILGGLALTMSSIMTFFAATQEAFIHAFRWEQWTLFFCLTSLTMAVGLTPTTFIALLTGYFLSWAALPPLVISYCIASALGYYAANWVDKGAFLQSISETKGVAGILKNIKKSEFKLVFFSRLSPILPFAVTNILLALAKVKHKSYYLGSLTGMLPRTTLSVYIGSTIATFSDIEQQDTDITSRLIWLSLITISSAGILRIFVKAFKSEN
ncbi:VTT domain-containing protein [Cytophagaceae bacterium ABcell3]|nr:VTT domain-containing protein [Cytophagaceae bacterium ABcell3]